MRPLATGIGGNAHRVCEKVASVAGVTNRDRRPRAPGQRSAGQVEAKYGDITQPLPVYPLPSRAENSVAKTQLWSTRERVGLPPGVRRFGEPNSERERGACLPIK